MKTIDQKHFTKNLLVLLKETFEGSPPQQASAYLDRGVGVLNTIEKLSAADASRSISDASATIAAHSEHLRFYLLTLLEFMNGRTEKVNWDESWLVKTVDETDWKLLQENVRRDYEIVIETVRQIED